MDSFRQNMYRSGFLNFLNEINIDFEDNMDFIQISNGCDLRFSIGPPNRGCFHARSKNEPILIFKIFFERPEMCK